MKKIRKDELVCELEREYASWDTGRKLGSRMGSAAFTNALYPYRHLFSAIEYNGLTAKNRVVYIPAPGDMPELQSGAPAESMKRFFIERAQGGTGLLCTQPVPADGSAFTANGWRELTAGVHARGSLILAQLDMISEKVDPASPLSSDSAYTRLIKSAAQAAANAVSSGFDGICLYGVSESLLDRMSSRAWNRKLLGRYSDPCAFGVGLVSEIRDRIGKNLPILYRIALSHAVNESGGENAGRRQRCIADTLRYMERLTEAGTDMFETLLGSRETEWLLSPAAAMPAGCCLDVSRAVLDYFKAAGVKANSGREVCVIGSGKLDCPDTAEAALRDGMCSAVSPGPAIAADALWCEKAAQGKCADMIPYCFEAQGAAFNVIPAPRKRTAVVGGGMRGMLCALEAARNGRSVMLFESSDALGGRLCALARPTINSSINNYLSSLRKRVAECSNITVRLLTRADAEILAAGSFESIVFAAGTKINVPPIPGWGEIPFVFAENVMKRPGSLPDLRGKSVVIIGGDGLGCACAWWLMSEMGCGKAAVIADTHDIMPGCAENDRSWAAHHLALRGVKLICSSVPVKISGGWLYYEEQKGGETALRCLRPDLIVLAGEGRESSVLYDDAVRRKAAPEIVSI